MQQKLVLCIIEVCVETSLELVRIVIHMNSSNLKNHGSLFYWNNSFKYFYLCESILL